jgi:putative transcriptional regulator
MNTAAFEQLLERVRRAIEASAGTRPLEHPFRVDALRIKELRAWMELSQPEFAALLGVELSTLRNWEQGRREPTGPAQALLRAIHNDPEHVIRALGRTRARARRTGLRREAAA